MNDSYDSPWKDAIREFLQPFLAFFFPAVEAEVDWSREVAFLDTELRSLDAKHPLATREADVLIQVGLRNGAAGWLWIHVEVQTQPVDDFAERMLGFYLRIRDLAGGRPVCSLGILADTARDWRPDRYVSESFGCRLEFKFPIVKLADFQPRLAELELSSNPFAVLVAAHLWTQATQKDPSGRLEAKICLARSLFKRGLGRGEISQLFRLVDWLLRLPAPQYEQEDGMPYMTSFELRGLEKGLKQGLERQRSSIVKILARRFGEVPPAVVEALQSIADPDRLEALCVQAAVESPSLRNFEELLRSA